jgi:hypothetical protein
VLLHPDQYAGTGIRDLLSAAASGWIGLDHRFLRSLLDRFDEAAPELVKFGLEERDDPVALEQDLISLFRLQPRAEALPFLIECIRRHPEDVADDLLDAFCRLGQAAASPLVDLYREMGAGRGQETAFVLAALGVRDPGILELLLERLAADPDDGAFLLGVYGDPAAIPPLEKALAEAPGEAETELRHAVERLMNPAEHAPLEPYDIWEDYPERAGPRFELLPAEERLEFLSSPSEEYRREAAASFTFEEVEGPVQEQVFEQAKSDPDASVRGSCWAALRVAHKDEQIRPAMLARLQDKAAPIEERCGALLGLAWESDDPAIRACFLELYDIPEARARALEAMWRSMDGDFATYFSRHLDDEDIALRREAIMGVGYLRMHSEVGRLERFLFDEELRHDALYAYALAAPGKVTAPHVRQVLAKIEELADGLSLEEADLVQTALDDLLALHGREPVFARPEDDEGEAEPALAAPAPGRNDPCPCGSGKKYKKCCGQ